MQDSPRQKTAEAGRLHERDVEGVPWELWGLYELVDTGILDDDRFFDVTVTYAKDAPDDLAIRIDVTNHGPEEAPIHVVPTLWFRNTWSWGREPGRPELWADRNVGGTLTVRAMHPSLGEYELAAADADAVIFTENETNTERLFGVSNAWPYVKDAFHAYVVEGATHAVNPSHTGTKAAAVYARRIPAHATVTFRLHLGRVDVSGPRNDPFESDDATLTTREAEADEFYAALIPPQLDADAQLVAWQALAGMLWSKQYYHYVVRDWLSGDPAYAPPPRERAHGRNADWRHLHSADVISMPDTWEFPWFATWDLAFHCMVLALVDPQFAEDQLQLVLREWYLKSDGRLPAYEWNFDDVNPPVLPAAAMRIFEAKRDLGLDDYEGLERIFHKLLINFTWWVNREDVQGNDIFEGGFLGLDNIGPFDRSQHLPDGYLLGQADGTAWMAMFCHSMLRIALTLAVHDPVYEDLAVKFFEHFLYIAHALNQPGSSTALWDEADGFFYDVLQTPDDPHVPVRARTAVGLFPMFEPIAIDPAVLVRFKTFSLRAGWFLAHRPDLTAAVAPLQKQGPTGRLLLSVVRPEQLHRILGYVLDETEFLSDHGVRAMSRYHHDHPFEIDLAGTRHRLDYEPGESTTDLFGGNSNWRGPVWMPINYLLVNALARYHEYFGDDFTVECPRGSGTILDLDHVALELARRLCALFLLDGQGRRPVWGDNPVFAGPLWQGLVPFHEYFHGETGRGCGASHQTGWTGLVADLILRFGVRF